MPSTRFFALVIKLPGTVPVRAPDRFPRFQQTAANDRQTFGSYRYGNNVSLASAQEDSRGSPATATVTGSRREISRQAMHQASPQVPYHLPCIPAEITRAPCGGVNGVSSSTPSPSQRQRTPLISRSVITGFLPVKVRARKLSLPLPRAGTDKPNRDSVIGSIHPVLPALRAAIAGRPDRQQISDHDDDDFTKPSLSALNKVSFIITAGFTARRSSSVNTTRNRRHAGPPPFAMLSRKSKTF